MRNFFSYFILLAIFALPGCASQEAAENNESLTSSSVSGTASTDSGDDPDELICRREQITGTNFRRQVCLTRAQRDAGREQSQQDVLQSRSANPQL